MVDPSQWPSKVMKDWLSGELVWKNDALRSPYWLEMVRVRNATSYYFRTVLYIVLMSFCFSITASHVTLRAPFAVIQHANAAIQRPCLLHGACFHIPKGTNAIDIRWPGHGGHTPKYTRSETKSVRFYLECLNRRPITALSYNLCVSTINCLNKFPLDLWFILVCSVFMPYELQNSSLCEETPTNPISFWSNRNHLGVSKKMVPPNHPF